MSDTPITDHIKAIRTILYERHRNATLDEIEQRVQEIVEIHFPSPILNDPWIPVREIRIIIADMRKHN